MRGPAILSMRWHDLLFASWPVAEERLRPLVPSALPIDTWGGSAWLTVVALRLSRVRPLRVPLPRELLSFSQVNVRTYTTVAGKPGIWLLSVDCDDRPTVAAARAGFGAPYMHADVSVAAAGERVRARSRRSRHGGSSVPFDASYAPDGVASPPEPGSLDDFIANRFSLYGSNRLGLLRSDIAHAPWPLQEAAADIDAAPLLGSLGLRMPSDPPILHFARELDVLCGLPVRLRGVDAHRLPGRSRARSQSRLRRLIRSR